LHFSLFVVVTIKNKTIHLDTMKRKDVSTFESSTARASGVENEHSGLTLRELIPPMACRENEDGAARTIAAVTRENRAAAAEEKDECNDASDIGNYHGRKKHDNEKNSDLAEPFHINWNFVINRVSTHPQEARESYFGPAAELGDLTKLEKRQRRNSDVKREGEKLKCNYKPLHAMLKYDPPLQAVEAILRAYPYAAMEDTFDGTPLKIAVESKVSSMLVLRLLLVAEMAMRKKNELMDESKNEPSLLHSDSDDVKMPAEQAPNNHKNQDRNSGQSSSIEENRLYSMFYGYNPISWICEPQIPVKTMAILLKWYPMGAYLREWGHDGTSENDFDYEHSVLGSPLIEIVDAFAIDDNRSNPMQQIDDESNEDDDYFSDHENTNPNHSDQVQGSSASRQQLNALERKQQRQERRWQKFLHILYATDKALTSIRPTTGPACAAAKTPLSDSNNESSPSSRFRPVHAWIRCITSPYLGLQHCRPYGCWSVLRVMGQRIPSEFKARDECDGGRTAFQTMAESPAKNCCLCLEEIRDVMECLMDADHRSAFSPRNSDGRLIGHVALENGWPCRDLFERKTSASCA